LGRARSLIALALLIAFGVAVAGIQHHRATRATVGKVSAAANQGVVVPPGRALARRVDGVGFPDWSARGWAVAGGRADVVGGRMASTVSYRRGQRTITYTLVAGSANVNDGTAVWVRDRETRGLKLELNWQNGPHRTLIARVVPEGGHVFIVTGRPASEALRREMTHLAAIGPAVS
jgi:hypothetical protein